jgi:glycerol-3-phosphate acyltransferase PlsY
MKKNPTFVILIVLMLANLIGSIANIYFIFNPSSYIAPNFDPYSFLDWPPVICLAGSAIFCFFLSQKVKDKYVKIFWLFFAAVFILNSKNYIFQGTGELSRIVSIFEYIISFFVLLIFLFIYKKHKFNLFEGLKKDKA